MTQKVERELAAAVEKLGKVTPYKMPEEIFREEMQRSREKIAQGAL